MDELGRSEGPISIIEAIGSMSRSDFERFAYEILETTREFMNVNGPLVLRGRQIDAVAASVDPLVGPTDWYIEIKAKKVISVQDVEIVSAKFNSLFLMNQHAVKHLLVTSGHLSAQAREAAQRRSLQVWDANELARRAPESLIEKYFGFSVLDSAEVSRQAEADRQAGERAAVLKETLRGLQPGKANWFDYQLLVASVFEFLFCPPLLPPLIEHSDGARRNRRDIALENAAADGFWAQSRSTYDAFIVIVDAKNYGGPLTKGPVINLAHYLKEYGCGRFGILASRAGSSKAAEHAIREQWIGTKKLIIPLSDDDMVQMLDLKAQNGFPDEVLRRKIAEFRMLL